MAKKAASKTTTSKTTNAAANTTKAARVTRVKAVQAVAPSVKVDRPKENRNILFARFNSELSPQALLAEMTGSFVLVSSVLFTTGDAFFTGLTLLVLAIAFLAISGSHLNPAVTFGLWTMRKITTLRVPFYWLAQFLGAIAAIVVMHLFSGEKIDFSLASFGQFEAKIFFAELIGMAVFMFGFAAAINRGQTDSDKALGMGLSLFLGLIIATGLLGQAVSSASQAQTDSASTSESRLTKVNNVALNPAVALALKERDPSAPQQGMETPASNTVLASRLTIETLFGTLIGAAIGGNLYALLAARARQDRYEI